VGSHDLAEPEAALLGSLGLLVAAAAVVVALATSVVGHVAQEM
jgi:hypothetical protein